uniref:Uncharacterized protein n=1 Tax=Daphnia magna TaxID=35525 RepID=A0A0P6HUA0_9CRUS
MEEEEEQEEEQQHQSKKQNEKKKKKRWEMFLHFLRIITDGTSHFLFQLLTLPAHILFCLMYTRNNFTSDSIGFSPAPHYHHIFMYIFSR